MIYIIPRVHKNVRAKLRAIDLFMAGTLLDDMVAKKFAVEYSSRDQICRFTVSLSVSRLQDWNATVNFPPILVRGPPAAADVANELSASACYVHGKFLCQVAFVS